MLSHKLPVADVAEVFAPIRRFGSVGGFRFPVSASPLISRFPVCAISVALFYDAKVGRQLSLSVFRFWFAAR